MDVWNLNNKAEGTASLQKLPIFFTHVVTFPALLTLPNPQLSEDIFFWVLGNSGQTRVTTWTTSTPWDGPEVAHYKHCSAFRISKDNLNIPFSWTNIHTKATEHHSGVFFLSLLHLTTLPELMGHDPHGYESTKSFLDTLKQREFRNKKIFLQHAKDKATSYVFCC